MNELLWLGIMVIIHSMKGTRKWLNSVLNLTIN